MHYNKSMNVQNTISQMRKGILDFCILSLISVEEIYSGELINKLKKAKLLVAEGTLYPLLSRLRKMDLLSYRWEESTNGPPRKYYTITDKGVQFLNELNKTWTEINKSVKIINRGKKS